MSDFRITIDEGGFNELVSGDAVRDALLAEGERIAAAARELAPKRSGEGAASIHAEAERGSEGWEVRISWDDDHQYMAAQRSSALQDAVTSAATS